MNRRLLNKNRKGKVKRNIHKAQVKKTEEVAQKKTEEDLAREQQILKDLVKQEVPPITVLDENVVVDDTVDITPAPDINIREVSISSPINVINENIVLH